MKQRKEFDKIYREYYPKLHRYASLYLSGDEAHDAVQEVFLHLLSEKRTLKEDTLNAYLYKSIQNRCIDILRHHTIKNQYSAKTGKALLQQETEYYYATRNDIEDTIINRELHDQIRAAVNKLPAKGRNVFDLYFEEQKSASEISHILDISVSTVHNHIYTCLKNLREQLGKQHLLLFFLLYFPFI
jgi:RNA polymerase sigma-70 factor (ECF subfamily)